MAKFSKANGSSRAKANSRNMADGVAYTRDNFKMEVATVILNSMINGDSYYESEKDRIARITKLIADNATTSANAEFLAKAMVYTRNTGNLRTVSHLMGETLVEVVKGEPFLKNALEKVMVRPDDAIEMIALWNQRHPGTNVPNSLVKATRMALENKWDAYQLRKYYGNGSVKVSNLIKIAHPSPKDRVKGDRVVMHEVDMREMFKQAMEGTLPTIQTAQTVNAGTKGEARAKSYDAMLREGKLGYMAALKNVRNIVESGADRETIGLLCNLLSNERAVRKSRLLPFRFADAYREVQSMNMDRILNKQLLKAIEAGFIASARNVSIVEDGESVALMLDESGSMHGKPFDIGLTLMASMLAGLDRDKVTGWFWANGAREVSVDGSPMEFIARNHPQGYATDVWSAIESLIKTKTFVDKIVVFTDMQMYSVRGHGREFKDMVKEYRKINPNVKVLFWNLQGYGGGTPMKLDHDILEVAGFSDSMLDVIAKMWVDKDALIKEIEAIDLFA